MKNINTERLETTIANEIAPPLACIADAIRDETVAIDIYTVATRLARGVTRGIV